MRNKKTWILLAASVLFTGGTATWADRTTLSLNQGWRFFRPQEGTPAQHDTKDVTPADAAFNDGVTFSVEGEGQIINDARIQANPVRAEAGIATVLVRSTAHAGAITVRATGFGLKGAEVKVQSQAMRGAGVPGRDVPG